MLCKPSNQPSLSNASAQMPMSFVFTAVTSIKATGGYKCMCYIINDVFIFLHKIPYTLMQK